MVWRYTRTGCCPRRESIISLLGRLLRAGTVRLALRWGHGTSRLLLGIPRPHPVDAARGGVDRSRFLDRRREEGEAPRRPHGRSLRPPGVQALHAEDRRPRISLADRSGLYRPSWKVVPTNFTRGVLSEWRISTGSMPVDVWRPHGSVRERNRGLAQREPRKVT